MRDFARRQPAPSRPGGSPLTVADEAGYLMVEVMVTAFLLVLLALGLYVGLDGATAASGNNKSRTVAAAVGQQDQERLRAFRAIDLSNYHTVSTVTVAGVPYMVASDADFVSDAYGTLSCTSTSGQADYLKITSTVSWPTMGTIAPVKEESLVAPPPTAFDPTKGNVTIKVTDHAGNPVAGIPVTLGSPANLSITTNTLGCSVFGQITPGNYLASATQSGYVDRSGNASASTTASVTTATTSTYPLSYDLAGQIAVSFATLVGNGPPQPALAQAVTVANSSLPAPGTRSYTAPGLQASVTATGLYPFTGAYNVYAGGCAANNPVTYNSNYFASNSGVVSLGPGQTATVTVRDPAINVAVTRLGVPLARAHVVVHPAGSGCTETYPSQSTNPLGALPAPGFPFGTYSVCADDGAHAATANVTSTGPAGTPPIALPIPTSGTGAVCS